MILIDYPSPGITSITLNRPEKRNALNQELLNQLIINIEKIHQDSSSRVIILRGEGKAFCAGMDLKEANDPTKNRQTIERIAEALRLLCTSPLITIAEIHGACLAGGIALATACDLTIASEETTFGFPEVKRGIVPAMVLSLLRHQIPERHLRELLLLGNNFDAWHAHRIGLINKICPHELLKQETNQLCQFAVQGSPAAIAECKILMERFHSQPYKDDIQQALQCHRSMLSHRDAQEGVVSFLEKRKPNWVP